MRYCNIGYPQCPPPLWGGDEKHERKVGAMSEGNPLSSGTCSRDLFSYGEHNFQTLF